MKVRTHLILMVIAVLLPITVCAGFAIHLLLEQERARLLHGMTEHASRVSLEVDNKLTRASAGARVLASSPWAEQGAIDRLFEQAKRVNAEPDVHFSLFDEQANILFNTQLPFAAPRPTLVPAHVQRIKGILARDVPVVSGVFVPLRLGRHVVAVDTPVKAATRRYLLTQWMFADSLKPLLASESVPPTWLVGLFDKQGLTIARNWGSAEFIGKPPQPDLVSKILSGQSGHFKNRSREGIDLYVVLARSAQTGWTTAVGVPVAEVEGTARKAIGVSLAGLVLALLAATAGAFILGQRLNRAIARSAKAADTLGQGEVPAIAETSITELNGLQQSLHQAGRLVAAAQKQRDEWLREAERARAQAETQNKAKDDFLAMLGHELRNPLAAITSGVSLLRMKGVEPQFAERSLDAMSRQAGHLVRLVDELLDASRVTGGKVTLKPQRMDLAQCASQALQALQAREEPGRREISLQTEPCFIDADPTRLDQVITNLLENAFKYTPDDGCISVSVRREDGKGVLEVRDSGEGIAPDVLPHVFDVFVQGPVRTRENGGLGIGLAVVKALVEQHGGSVEAQSDGIGRGSRFICRFPLSTALPVPPSESRELPDVRGLRVLLVEDNDDARTMLCEALLHAGADVRAACDGAEALEIAIDHQPHAFIIDIDLPDMSGHEVVRRLRADPRSETAFMIALTGYGQDQDRARALEAGFDMHMKKPVDLADLLASLLRFRAA